MGRPGVLRRWLAFFDVYNSNLALPVVNGVGMAVSVEAADWVWRMRPGMREEKKFSTSLTDSLLRVLGFSERVTREPREEGNSWTNSVISVSGSLARHCLEAPGKGLDFAAHG